MFDYIDENSFYENFDEWYNEQIGYSFRSEHIMDAILAADQDMIVKYIKIAWELGRRSKEITENEL
jgi:hypothetical protein